jgi:hypothetical protein
VEGSPKLLADGNGRKTGMAAAFSDMVGAPVAGVVLRQGRKKEGAQAQVYPEKKAAKGVLGAPLTMEWVVTVEAVEVPVIGRLLAVSSCTDGEKVMRGGSRLQRKARQRGEGGGTTAIPVEEHSVTGRRDGVARSDSETTVWLQTGGGFRRQRTTAFNTALSGRP